MFAFFYIPWVRARRAVPYAEPACLRYYDCVSGFDHEVFRISLTFDKIVIWHGKTDFLPSPVSIRDMPHYLEFVSGGVRREPTGDGNRLENGSVRFQLVLAGLGDFADYEHVVAVYLFHADRYSWIFLVFFETRGDSLGQLVGGQAGRLHIPDYRHGDHA